MKLVNSIIMGVVLLVFVVSVIASTVTTVDNAGNNVTVVGRCINEGCFYNASRAPYGICTSTNESAEDSGNCSTTSAEVLPLETLFSSGGVITLLFLATALLLTVGVAWGMYKKKN